MPSCEFCDMTLQSHLDVSKHIVSQTHRDNVKKYRDRHPLNKANLKDTPSNILKVFESLKLRTASDVRNLADKTYFRIRSQDKEKSAAFLSVTDELVNVLLACIVDYRTRFCNDENRKKIKDAICRPKEELKEQCRTHREKQSTPGTRSVSSSPAQQPKTANLPALAPTSKSTSEHTTDPDSNSRRSPPLKKRPPPVNPKSNPVRPSQSVRASTLDPARATRSVDEPRARSPNEPRGPVTQQARTSNPRPNLVNPQRPRTAGLIPGPRPVAPQGSTVQSRSSNRQSDSRISESQPIRQAFQQMRNSRSPAPQTDRPHRPMTPQNARGPRPATDIPPPEQMPMTGASFMPYNPNSPVQPRLDSSYKPKLAKIKVEPRDN